MSNKGFRKSNYMQPPRQHHDHQESPHLLTPRIWWLLQKGKSQRRKQTQRERI